MLMAAAVRAPTSVAMALFTLAVSAASLVNSPVVRRFSGGASDAQPVKPALSVAAAIVARATFRMVRRLTFIGFSVRRTADRLVVARLHRVERPACRLRFLLH